MAAISSLSLQGEGWGEGLSLRRPCLRRLPRRPPLTLPSPPKGARVFSAAGRAAVWPLFSPSPCRERAGERGLSLRRPRLRRLPRRPPHPSLSPEEARVFFAVGRSVAWLLFSPSPCRERAGERGLSLCRLRLRRLPCRPPHPSLSPGGGEGILCCREVGGLAAVFSLSLQGEGRGEGSFSLPALPAPAAPPSPSPFPLPRRGRGYSLLPGGRWPGRCFLPLPAGASRQSAGSTCRPGFLLTASGLVLRISFAAGGFRRRRG